MAHGCKVSTNYWRRTVCERSILARQIRDWRASTNHQPPPLVRKSFRKSSCCDVGLTVTLRLITFGLYRWRANPASPCRLGRATFCVRIALSTGRGDLRYVRDHLCNDCRPMPVRNHLPASCLRRGPVRRLVLPAEIGVPDLDRAGRVKRVLRVCAVKFYRSRKFLFPGRK